MNLLKLEGEEVDERDVEESIDRLVSPGESIVVPAIGPAEPSSLVRGKEIYLRQGCKSCHGEDGAGRDGGCAREGFVHEGLSVGFGTALDGAF